MISDKQARDWAVRVLEEQLSIAALTDLLDSLVDRLAAELGTDTVESLTGTARLMKVVSSNLRSICDDMANG